MSGLLETEKVAIVQWAERRAEVKRVYLYGSRARGDHHVDSDIDLAVEVFAQPGDSDSFTTWIYLKQDYDASPDLHLSAEVQCKRYFQVTSIHGMRSPTLFA